MSELVTGEPKVVLNVLAALSERLVRDSTAKDIVDQSHAYLAKREGQIQYRRFKAAGLPIGSGIVESANKLVMQARCKGAGMHWRAENINPILALRCAYLSGHWQTGATLAQERLRLQHDQDRARRRRARQQSRRARQARLTRPPRFFNGHPTKHHPWKRYPLVSAPHAKL